MSQNISSIFLSLLFLAFLAAPTIISMVDNSIDTSIFYSVTEEEENGKVKSLISPFSLQNNNFLTNFSLKANPSFSYRFKKYPKPHLNLISPPPEFSIL